MGNGLMEKAMSQDDYQEYLDKIANIFRISDSHSSILYDIKIKDYQARAKLSIVNMEGEKKEFQDIMLDCDQAFSSSFLIPLVEKICEIVEVQTKDIVNLTEDDLVTFRIITNNNDLFTIDGLSPDDANNLLLLSQNIQVSSPKSISSSRKGGLMIFTIIILIIIAGLFTAVLECRADINMIRDTMETTQKSMYHIRYELEEKFKQLDTKYSCSSIKFNKLDKEIDSND